MLGTNIKDFFKLLEPIKYFRFHANIFLKPKFYFFNFRNLLIFIGKKTISKKNNFKITKIK